MKKWLWAFADSISGLTPAIITVITFLGVIIFGTWQSAKQQLSEDATHIIYLLFGSCVLLLFLLVATRVALIRRKEDALTKIGMFILEGVELRNKLLKLLHGNEIKYEDAKTLYIGWTQSVDVVLMEYQPHLALYWSGFSGVSFNGKTSLDLLFNEMMDNAIHELKNIYSLIATR